MKFKKRLLRFLGIERKSEYVRDYLAFSNVRSGIYLSIVVIALEIWMIASITITQLVGKNPRSLRWLMLHVPAYVILLAAGIVMLVYSIVCLKKKKTYRYTGGAIYGFFSLIGISFGILISYLDFARGEQFITLITMAIFVFCFLVWRPWFSIMFITVAFLIFYAMCNTVLPATYATKVNLFIMWISLLMAAINLFHQKIAEARKDEKLEQANNILVKLSISDEVTGIANMNYFRSQTLSKILNKSYDISKSIFLFLDIEHFKNFNEKFGFLEGNEFLFNIAHVIQNTFADAITAHFSNDNFVIFDKDEGIKEKLAVVAEEIRKNARGINLTLKTGAYRPLNRDCLPIVACDRARYACNSVKKHFETDYCEYDSSMDRDFHRKQYIINSIDSAIVNNYIKVYYQPVVDSKTGRLVGAEALARWNDPEFGFLTPDMFIKTLEEYHQIHKLDMAVLYRVCNHLKDSEKSGCPVIPVSLNFSRLDFDVLDLAEEVHSVLMEYGIDKKYIHVEITESALTENNSKLREAMDKFRSSGYALWLDDFGSGYSGLNVLKEYEFDVMKIDMKFLHNFSGNKRSQSILKSIVSLAKDIGMCTLSEGVETEDAQQFLTEIGCEKMQGYLFGKPMTYEELTEKIKSGIYKLEDTDV